MSAKNQTTLTKGVALNNNERKVFNAINKNWLTINNFFVLGDTDVTEEAVKKLLVLELERDIPREQVVGKLYGRISNLRRKRELKELNAIVDAGGIPDRIEV